MKTNSRSVDIDRGWAFVVLAGCFLVEMLIMWTILGAAVIYAEMLEEFEASPTTAAWSLNLCPFLTHVLGELANASVHLVGLRITLAIGTFVSTLGLLACAFASSAFHVLISYGIVTSIGYVMTLLPSIYVIPQHFHRHRATAFAVRSIGSSLGNIFVGPFIRFLFDEYRWSGAFLILAGINLHQLLAAAAAIPPRLPQETSQCGQALLQSSHNGKQWSKKVRTSLRRLVSNLSLFRKARFCVFTVSYILTTIGVSAFFTHVTNFALVSGNSKMASALLPTIFGISCLVTRPVVGALIQRLDTNVMGLHVTFLVSIGGISIVFGFMSSYTGLAVCTVLVGLCYSTYGLFAEIVIFMTGMDRLESGLSYYCIAVGTGWLMGGPIASRIYEFDPSYQWTFVIIGAITIIGGLMNLVNLITFKNGRPVVRRGADKMGVRSS